MENTDAPGVRGEQGERRVSGRGHDSPDAHFFFTDADQISRRGKQLWGRRDGWRSQQGRWVHRSEDKSVGRHQAHGMRKIVRRRVWAHGMHRADTTCLAGCCICRT